MHTTISTPDGHSEMERRTDPSFEWYEAHRAGSVASARAGLRSRARFPHPACRSPLPPAPAAPHPAFLPLRFPAKFTSSSAAAFTAKSRLLTAFASVRTMLCTRVWTPGPSHAPCHLQVTSSTAMPPSTILNWCCAAPALRLTAKGVNTFSAEKARLDRILPSPTGMYSLSRVCSHYSWDRIFETRGSPPSSTQL